MINEFLKQIISLDRSIDRERANIEKTVTDIESEARDRIRREENQELEETREKSKKRYDQELVKAQKLRETYLEESKQECDNLVERYESIKKSCANKVAQELIMENINAEQSSS